MAGLGRVRYWASIQREASNRLPAHSRGKRALDPPSKAVQSIELDLGDLDLGDGVLGLVLGGGEDGVVGGRQQAGRAAPQVGAYHLTPRDLGAARIKGFTARLCRYRSTGKLHLDRVLAAVVVLADVGAGVLDVEVALPEAELGGEAEHAVDLDVGAGVLDALRLAIGLHAPAEEMPQVSGGRG